MAQLWELSFDGSVVGPYTSIQVQNAFLQGKLTLSSQVRLLGHVGFKSLAQYWHLVCDPDYHKLGSANALTQRLNSTSSSEQQESQRSSSHNPKRQGS